MSSLYIYYSLSTIQHINHKLISQSISDQIRFLKPGTKLLGAKCCYSIVAIVPGLCSPCFSPLSSWAPSFCISSKLDHQLSPPLNNSPNFSPENLNFWKGNHIPLSLHNPPSYRTCFREHEESNFALIPPLSLIDQNRILSSSKGSASRLGKSQYSSSFAFRLSSLFPPLKAPPLALQMNF